MATNPISPSGSIDINAIVSKLMEVESQPLIKLQQKENGYQAKISGYGILLSALSEFKSTVSNLKDPGLIGMKAEVSDASFMSVSASGSASLGNYTIQVKNTATAQSIYSSPFTAETDTVADLSTNPIQKLQIQVGTGSPVTIAVDSSNNTLSGIKDAINGSGLGIRASIINDGSGYRLVLSADSTGASNRIVIRVDEDNNGVFEEWGADIDTTGLSRLSFNPTYDPDGNVTGGIANMSQSQAAQDARLRVDGLEVTRPTNTINDLITGVTIELKKGDNYGSSISLTVSKEKETLKNKLDSFVSAYNQLMNNLKNLKGNADRRGALSGESILSGIQNTIRSITITSYNDKTLTLLGITHDRNGVLSIDPSRFDAALSSDETDVISTINQMASSLESSLNDYINTLIPARKNGYEQTIRAIQKEEDDLTARLQLKEIALRRQFTNLDTLLNQLQGTSNFITQQVENLGKILGGK
jgi:flagellar hook-associated protein 2